MRRRRRAPTQSGGTRRPAGAGNATTPAVVAVLADVDAGAGAAGEALRARGRTSPGAANLSRATLYAAGAAMAGIALNGDTRAVAVGGTRGASALTGDAHRAARTHV